MNKLQGKVKQRRYVHDPPTLRKAPFMFEMAPHQEEEEEEEEEEVTVVLQIPAR